MRAFRLASRNTSDRQCCGPFSRGAILVLVWSVLLNATRLLGNTSLRLALPSDLELQFEYQCVYYSLWLLLPVTGWVAESWLGRYRAITAGFFLSVTAMLVSVSAFIMLQFSWTPIPALTISCIGLLIGTVGIGILYTILLPFTLDQMIGASADELSAVVQWYYWGSNSDILC